MSTKRRSIWSRAILGGLAVGLIFLMAGDRPAQTATIGGIDPLEILKLQVRNNLLFIFDTSGSMKWPLDRDNFTAGADDPMSRMYQAKQAVKAVVDANKDRLNIGLASYNILAASKPLNNGEEFGSNRDNGPLIYVSPDANADVFYQPYACDEADGDAVRDGFFCDASDTSTEYDGTNNRDVFRSFSNGRDDGNDHAFDDPYPAGCAPGADCRYYMDSRLFRDGVRYTWDLTNFDTDTNLLATSNIVCPTPPDGFLSSDGPRPCFQMQAGTGGPVATFYFTSATYDSGGGLNCDGAALISAVAACDNLAGQAASVQTTLDAMRPELPLATLLAEIPGQGPDLRDDDNTTVAGLRAAQSTPLAGSLVDVRTANPPFFPVRPAAVATLQKNFVILLTDGDDTCAGGTGDFNATEAGRAAEDLFDNTADPRHQAETMVVAFTSAVNIDRANTIAKAGSGGHVVSELNVSCPVGDPDRACRDAFTATNLEELIRALNKAIELTLTAGELSAAGPTLASVFELGPVVNDPNCVGPTDPNPSGFPVCADPLNPKTRYNNRVNIAYQPTFELPEFHGHLYAFQNDGTYQPVGATNFSGRWDAGETLLEQVSQVLEATDVGRGPNQFTFAELHGGANTRDMTLALIKRRIFTSSPVAGVGTSAVNRTYDRSSNFDDWDASLSTGTNVVALWPPDQTGLGSGVGDIDPPVGTPGPLDGALEIAGLSFDELRTELGACDTSATIPTYPDCDFAGNPALALNTARKEARQIILAHAAGAEVLRSATDGRPLRDSSTFELLYKDRGWLLLDSTFIQPTVVTPPLRSTPNAHIREWLLFRDGRRGSNRQGINEIDSGFGLRNPDVDDVNPESKLDLKPVMTVVYLAANDGLHAFRAGPNCAAADPTLCAEPGSRELWNFVPYDQLGKLRVLLQGQVQEPHTYMIGSSPRVVDLFVPLPIYSLAGVTYNGRWRVVIFIGRGAGGKFYTALDVTAPGPFTRPALQTNPPWVMWNHGNEDGVLDAYDGMGQTWSVPAVGNVDPLTDGLPEWRIWTGSGYSEDPGEGTTFYMLDAVTGGVLYARNVGDGLPTHFPDNALVASPAGYNAFQLDRLPRYADPSSDKLSRLYIPDIHGRIWKFDTSSGGMVEDLGPDQPIANAVGLLKLDSGGSPQPHVYAESGNDSRVPDDRTFYAFAFRDEASDGDLSTQLHELFPPIPLVDSNGLRYRGTVQPATAFNAEGFARVFYLGTRYSGVTPDCLSRFDSLLFGILAVSGGAAYDFNNDGSGDLSVVITGDKATGLQVAGGQLLIGDSGGLGDPPGGPEPPPIQPSPKPPEPAEVVTNAVAAGSPVCRQ